MKRLTFLILFFLPVMLSAQWENVGPEGAILYSLDSPQPGIFYAGGYGTGLWKSTDNGNSWSLTSSVYETPIWDICASHQDPNLIFVLTAELSGWGYGETNLYKSTDGGLTWEYTTNVWHVYGSTGCAKILVGPTSAIYFLSQSTSNFGHRDAQLFRSTDFGTSFSEPMDSIESWNSGITIDDSENVYLCMYDSYSTSHFEKGGIHKRDKYNR